METSTLATLRDEYPTSSWALWSSDFPNEGCVEERPSEFYEFITQNRGRLEPSIVLLSLNPSTELPEQYQNFHSTDPKHRNDQFRDLVEEAGLEGAYMTDLVERVEPDSGNVEPTDEDVANLFEQLRLLDQEKFFVICFLEEVYQTLRGICNTASRELRHDVRAFSCVHDEIQLECYRVWFHANWGANKDKIPELRKQLSYLSSLIDDGGIGDLSNWVD